MSMIQDSLLRSRPLPQFGSGSTDPLQLQPRVYTAPYPRGSGYDSYSGYDHPPTLNVYGEPAPVVPSLPSYSGPESSIGGLPSLSSVANTRVNGSPLPSGPLRLGGSPSPPPSLNGLGHSSLQTSLSGLDRSHPATVSSSSPYATPTRPTATPLGYPPVYGANHPALGGVPGPGLGLGLTPLSKPGQQHPYSLHGRVTSGPYMKQTAPGAPSMMNHGYYPIYEPRMAVPGETNGSGRALKRKHNCGICGKEFARPSALQTHIYSHTGEKPFRCDHEGCGRSFSVVSNLRRHRRVHMKVGGS